MAQFAGISKRCLEAPASRAKVEAVDPAGSAARERRAPIDAARPAA
jgi:hypothetical protein